MSGLRNLLLMGTAAVVAVAAPASSEAATYTYDINQLFNGNGGFTTSPTSYGTVTISDDATNSKAVDFTIDLTGAGQKIQEFDFNSNINLSGAGLTAKSLNYGTLTVGYSSNGVQADGYTAGKFDIQTPSNGSFGNVIDPLSFVLTSNTGLDLDASFFNTKDSATNMGFLYNAVHIANCSTGTNGCIPGGSIWAGSSGTLTPPQSIPEPTSIMVLGATLLGVGFLRKGTRKNA